MNMRSHVYLEKGSRFFFIWVKADQAYYKAGRKGQYKRYEFDYLSNGYDRLISTIHRHVRSGYKPATPPADMIAELDNVSLFHVEHCGHLTVESKGLTLAHFDAVVDKFSDIFKSIDFHFDFSKASVSITDSDAMWSADFGNMSALEFDGYSEQEKEFMLERGLGTEHANNPNGDGMVHFAFGSERISAAILVLLKQLSKAGANIKAYDANNNFMHMDAPWSVFETEDWYDDFLKEMDSSVLTNPHQNIGEGDVGDDVCAWL